VTDRERNVEFYSKLYDEHGDSWKSLNWGSRQSQNRRFEVLAGIAPLQGTRILDVGCGLGDLLGWLRTQGIVLNYTGLEVTPTLANRAAARFPDACILNIDFDAVGAAPDTFDYVFASGIFYLRQADPEAYLRKTVRSMFDLAKRGVAFNSLSTWASNRDSSEFYADPEMLLEYCRTLTRSLVLRHDYHPADFTIYLYKTGAA
jgi:SAM-dependent methyltransferase